MFKDFAIYDNVGQPDPAVAYVRNGAEATSGGVGNAWTRPHMTFVPERDSSFLAIGARVLGINQSTVGSEHLNAQHFTKWQLERAQSTYLPRAYSPAREVQVVVKPDRINLAPNPSMTVDVASYGGSTRSTAWFSSAPASLVITPSGATNNTYAHVGGNTGGGMRLGMVAGGTYTISATINTPIALTGTLNGLARSITLQHRAGAGGLVIDKVTGPTTGVARLSLTVTLPVGTTEAAVLLYNGSGVANEVVYWDDIVVEPGVSDGTPIDGSMGDDYVWEGTAHNSRSYYYENRLDRGEAIVRALRDVVPLGIGVGTAQFGVFTG